MVIESKKTKWHYVERCCGAKLRHSAALSAFALNSLAVCSALRQICRYHGKATHHQIAPDYGGALLVNKRQYGDCRTLSALIRHLGRPDKPDGWRAPLTVPVPPGIASGDVGSQSNEAQGVAAPAPALAAVHMRRKPNTEEEGRGGEVGSTAVVSAATAAARRHRMSMNLGSNGDDDGGEGSVYAVAKVCGLSSFYSVHWSSLNPRALVCVCACMCVCVCVCVYVCE